MEIWTYLSAAVDAAFPEPTTLGLIAAGLALIVYAERGLRRAGTRLLDAPPTKRASTAKQ